jgi:hypothetical protein
MSEPCHKHKSLRSEIEPRIVFLKVSANGGCNQAPGRVYLVRLYIGFVKEEGKGRGLD